MAPQLHVQNATAVVPQLSAYPIATDRHRAALQKLNYAFEQEQPVAKMIGDDKHEFSHVIGAFAEGLADSATVVHLKSPQGSALDAMREICSGLGFDPKDLSLCDLKNILTMFLEYQDKHSRRTVLCIEYADERELWLIDCIASLITPENSRQSRLLIVLTGGSRLNDLINNASFEVIGRSAGRAIRLAPFTFAETREFIGQRSEALGLRDINELFEFEAVDRLHKLSGGEPQAVAKLCQETLESTVCGKQGPVTVKMVLKTARRLRKEASADLALAVVDNSPVSDSAARKEQLVIRSKGALLQRFALRRGRFMVGRMKSADICLQSSLISRRHALIIKTAESLQVLDLGSTNGTYVSGERVREHTLEPGTVVTLGDCDIECVLAEPK